MWSFNIQFLSEVMLTIVIDEVQKHCEDLKSILKSSYCICNLSQLFDQKEFTNTQNCKFHIFPQNKDLQ